MELVFQSEELEEQCTVLREAQKRFGGNKALALSLLSRINALYAADCLKDIVVQPVFHFHNLGARNGKNLTGYFAVDVRTRRDPWRILLQPLDENRNPFVPCRIDEISHIVKTVKIMEVSKHYE